MRKRSSSSAEVRFFTLDYDYVMEKLKDYAKKCVEKGARAVLLIGSLARGDYTAFSDADVVIVVDKAPPRAVDRIKDFIDSHMPLDVEPRVYTLEELRRLAMQRSKIVEEIVRYGKLLAGDESVLTMLRNLFE